MNTTNFHTDFENDPELVSLHSYLSGVSKSILVDVPPLVTKSGKLRSYVQKEQQKIPSPFTKLFTTYKVATFATTLILLVGISTSTFLTRSSQEALDTASVIDTESLVSNNSGEDSGIMSESQVISSSVASTIDQLVDLTLSDLLVEDNQALASIDTLSSVAADDVINQLTQITTYEI